MITLGTRNAAYANFADNANKRIIRVSQDTNRPNALREREAYLVSDAEVPEGFECYIAIGGQPLPMSLEGKPTIVLPTDFSYLADGDIVRAASNSNELRVLYRRSSPHNSFLLTERCNNYCLMCSQPPRDVDDGWIVDEILEAIPLIDMDTKEIGFTGGEPTLLGDRFFELVQACKAYLPRTALHVLSNGRSFADTNFADRLGALRHPDLMIGIPVYSDIAHIHDYVVQADGAFDETLRGIINLKERGVPVEIRVVIHKQTYERLPNLARFIARNLLFVDHVALMGLEIMGFTRANLEALWIDPFDYKNQLTEATEVLNRAKMRVSIYNAQLCLTAPSIWRFATRSISDWKQEYMPACDGCEVKSHCAGFFASAKYRVSERVSPIFNSEHLAETLAA